MISGSPFQSPFASPPGGLSSSMVNVLWVLLNLLLGYYNFHVHVTEAPGAPRAFDQRSVYSGEDGNVYQYPIDPAIGSEATAKAGSVHQTPHEPTCHNKPSAATWANNDSTTSVRLAVGFRTPPPGLATVTERTTVDPA
jgi:hypothetical protein